jgi:hypothetical protein
MSEQKRDLVDTLTGEQRPARDGVAKTVHRRDRAVRDSDRLALENPARVTGGKVGSPAGFVAFV